MADTRDRTRAPRIRSRTQAHSRPWVSEAQRSRMLRAMAELTAERGFAGLTVAQVIERAHVSRKTFYEMFSDREDCFVAALEEAIEEAGSRARAGYALAGSWCDGVRAALAELLALIDHEPALARMCLVASLSGGARVLELRERTLAELARVIDRGRTGAPAPGQPAGLTSEAIVGGVTSVLNSRLAAPGTQPVADLLGPLMSVMVMPYLGPDAARSELERSLLRARRAPVREPGASVAPTRSARNARSAARRPQMRLTYRTLRVLAVISERPGASNREVAECSGIADPAQISKLATRLARLGLIENLGAGKARGGANAWRLTERGRQVASMSPARIT